MRSSVASPTLLPVEIWLSCWTLCSRRQLRRLSLVCRLFRSLILPLLVQHQTIDIATLATGLTLKTLDRLRRLHRTSVRLDKLSAAPYALSVRSWNVTFKWRGSSWYLPGVKNMQSFDTLNERVVSTFSTTLRLYQNLSSLHLTHVTVDGFLRETLALLPRLEDLGLCNWDIIVHDGFLPLQRLILSEPGPTDTQEPLQIGCPGSLRTLHAGNCISRLITGFGPRILHQLVDLSLVTVKNVNLFFRFLGQCPRLEFLAVHILDNRVALPISVDAKIIPHLRTLTGPPKLHHLLIPGRAISSATVLPDTSVGVAQSQELIHVCFVLARSSVPIRSLNLMPKEAANLELLAAVTTLFPDLKELSLTLPEPADSPFISICYRRRTPPPVDLEWPDLDDDTAFDNITVDDISDNEADESSAIVVVKAGKPETHQADSMAPPPLNYVHEIFNWISDGILPLPPSLEVLRLDTRGAHSHLPNLPRQHRAIATLAPMFPNLREVQLGSESTNWKRFGIESGEVWRSDGGKARIQMVETFVD